MQHVVNHGTYHRGNITAMIRQLGHSSTMMDFVLYLHMVKKQESNIVCKKEALIIEVSPSISFRIHGRSTD